MTAKMYSFFDLLKVILGITLVYVSSQYIVNQTLVYAQELHFEVFYLSLLVLSIGTNLPELSLAVRAIISGKKDIAFGDYLGSASANTLLFGIFTLINDGEVLTSNSFLFTFGTIVVGLSCFYYFAQTKRKISVKEGARILQGEKIATQGNTGHTTAEHLHFEILLNGKQINPFDLISHACNY